MADNEVQISITADASDIKSGMSDASEAVKGFSSQSKDALEETKGQTSALTKEFIVLGHEVMTGEFSKIPGSLLVLGEHMGGIGKLAAAFVEAFAVEKVVEGIGELESHFSELGESINRTSKMTGLSTDQIQQFSFAVKMSGGDAQAATVTLERLERQIAEASTGTGRAAELFKNLGISINDAAGAQRPFADIMGDIAEKYKDTADGANKVAFSQEAMGRSGVQLIAFFDQGRAGLAAMNEELKKSGSQLTPQQVKSFTELAESMKLLTAQWEGFKLGVANFFEPATKSVVDGMTQMLDNVHLLTGDLGKLKKAFTSIFTVANGRSLLVGAGLGGSQGLIGPKDAPHIPETGHSAPYNAKQDLPPLPPTGSVGKDEDDSIAKTKIQEAQIIADGKIAIEREENEQSLAMSEETDKEYLQRKIELLNQEHSINDAALKNESSSESDPAKREEINKQLIASDQKYALLHMQLTDKMKQLDLQAASDVEKQEDGAIKRRQVTENLQFQLEEEENKQKLALQQITNDQYLKAEQALIAKMHAIDVQAIQQKEAADKDNVAKYQEDLNKMAQDNAAYQLKIKQQSNAEILDQEQGWLQLQNSIKDSMTNTVTTFLSGTNNMKKAFNDLEQSILKDIDQMLAKKLVTGLFSGITGGSGGTGSNITSFANMTGISGAISTVASWLPSFDTGSWSLPGDMIANVHKGEMIVPANQASSIREGGGLGGNHYYNMTFNTPDVNSFRENSGQAAVQFAAMMSKAKRNQ